MSTRVRFTPKSGHVQCKRLCPLWATSGHSDGLRSNWRFHACSGVMRDLPAFLSEKKPMTAISRRTMLVAATAVTLPITGFSALAQVDQKLAPDEARTLARDAWLFGLPLVYIDTQIDTVSHVTKPQGPFAPVSQFAHYRE